MDDMTEIECVTDTNCTVEMDPETFKSDYLERRYTESWLGALVALVLLFCLFLCEILISIRKYFMIFIFIFGLQSVDWALLRYTTGPYFYEFSSICMAF